MNFLRFKIKNNTYKQNLHIDGSQYIFLVKFFCSKSNNFLEYIIFIANYC